MTSVTRTINYETNSPSDLNYIIIINNTGIETGPAPIPQGTFNTTINTIDNYELSFFGGGAQGFNSVNILPTNIYGDANVQVRTLGNFGLITYYESITIKIDISPENILARTVSLTGSSLEEPIIIQLTDEDVADGVYLLNVIFNETIINNALDTSTLFLQLGTDSQPINLFRTRPERQVYGPYTRRTLPNSPTTVVGTFSLDGNIYNSNGIPTGDIISTATILSSDISPSSFTLPSNLQYTPNLLNNVALVPGVRFGIIATTTNGINIITTNSVLSNIDNCFRIVQIGSTYLLTPVSCNSNPIIITRPIITNKQVTIIGRDIYCKK